MHRKHFSKFVMNKEEYEETNLNSIALSRFEIFCLGIGSKCECVLIEA